MPALNIADGLKLPADAVTQTFAIMAIRGVGKTHTASVFAEELLKIGQPICVYDPTGAWWGLKSSADGKRPGFPVVVFGGEHADVPLQETAGEVVARTIVENRTPAILDCSLLRKGARVRFMTDFCETLYHLNREALHVFLDEAHTLAPQNIRAMPEAARCLGAIEDIILQGRRRGLGLTAISQRPAVLNTTVRTQCQVLIAMRIVGPHDRKAISEWVDIHGDPSEAKAMMDSLPRLAVGEGWVWSPGWLDVFKRVTFRERETFDSSATPTVGKKLRGPSAFAEIDLSALGKAIQATVQQAKENDPKELKRRIAELQKQLASQKPAADQAAIDRAVSAAVAQRDREWQATVDQLQSAVADRTQRLQQIESLAHLNGDAAVAVAAPPSVNRNPVSTDKNSASTIKSRALTDKPAQPTRKAAMPEHGETPPLTSAQRRILNALAWWESVGVTEPTVEQVAFVARINPKGGHFSNTVGPLSTADLIDRTAGVMRLTDAGRAMCDAPGTPPTLEEYHAGIKSILKTGAQQRILDAVVEAGGDVTTEDIGAATGIDPRGGHFSNSIGPLGTLGLIERRSGVVRPTDLLFPAGLA